MSNKTPRSSARRSAQGQARDGQPESGWELSPLLRDIGKAMVTTIAVLMSFMCIRPALTPIAIPNAHGGAWFGNREEAAKYLRERVNRLEESD